MRGELTAAETPELRKAKNSLAGGRLPGTDKTPAELYKRLPVITKGWAGLFTVALKTSRFPRGRPGYT